MVQPERPTLEPILTALGARYSDRREILEHFGYVVTTPAPTEEDIRWVRVACQRELHESPFPAYVLDCTHRLIAWNHIIPDLFGIGRNDPTLGKLAHESLVAAWFDPASPLARLILEPDRFLPSLIHVIQSEMQRGGGEMWHKDMITRLCKLPRFCHYWAMAE